MLLRQLEKHAAGRAIDRNRLSLLSVATSAAGECISERDRAMRYLMYWLCAILFLFRTIIFLPIQEPLKGNN